MPSPCPNKHAVLGTPIEGPVPDGFEVAVFGLGCFWGEEKMFWELDGVYSTSVGYAGGVTPNPSYEEVCTGRTGHAEVVRVVFDPSKISYDDLLKVFWEAHNPTQGMRQGNDIGSQYRSVLLVTSEAQAEAAERSRAAYQKDLTAQGYGEITTSIVPLDSTTSPRTTTSSTCTRTPTATARSTRPASSFPPTPEQYIDGPPPKRRDIRLCVMISFDIRRLP